MSLSDMSVRTKILSSLPDHKVSLKNFKFPVIPFKADPHNTHKELIEMGKKIFMLFNAKLG
jgi:hypothetical protein